MPDLYGLSLLIDRFIADYEKNKKALNFTTRWIDSKFRDGGRITAREYQEFLAELGQVNRWKIRKKRL